MSIELTQTQLMTVMQWLSPAFPVGAFSYSHGLEWACQEDSFSLEPWLEDVLRHGAGRNDAILLRAAYAGAVEEADSLGRALSPSKERLLETSNQGAAFCRAMRQSFALEMPDMIYPVAFGHAASVQGLPCDGVVGLYLHAFMSNLVSAAQRLTPLGQSDAQAMVARLSPLCEEIAQTTAALTLDDLGGFAWGADVASMAHETQYSRIFRT